eukprot:290362-Rhodomonas_salina.1
MPARLLLLRHARHGNRLSLPRLLRSSLRAMRLGTHLLRSSGRGADGFCGGLAGGAHHLQPVSYTHLRAHETEADL